MHLLLVACKPSAGSIQPLKFTVAYGKCRSEKTWPITRINGTDFRGQSLLWVSFVLLKKQSALDLACKKPCSQVWEMQRSRSGVATRDILEAFLGSLFAACAFTGVSADMYDNWRIALCLGFRHIVVVLRTMVLKL